MKKKIILSILIIILFITTSIVIALVCQSGMEYITILVTDEQNNHYDKMQKHIKDLHISIEDLESDVFVIHTKYMKESEQKEMIKKLHHIEEIAWNISQETGFYNEDTTVHFFFEPEINIITYFRKTRSTPLYINRFVRATEKGLFEKYLTKTQKETIMESFTSLKVNVEDL